jgi:hypothetical protein
MSNSRFFGTIRVLAIRQKTTKVHIQTRILHIIYKQFLPNKKFNVLIKQILI